MTCSVTISISISTSTSTSISTSTSSTSKTSKIKKWLSKRSTSKTSTIIADDSISQARSYENTISSRPSTRGSYPATSCRYNNPLNHTTQQESAWQSTWQTPNNADEINRQLAQSQSQSQKHSQFRTFSSRDKPSRNTDVENEPAESPSVPSRRRRENDIIDREWHEHDGQILEQRKGTLGRAFSFTMSSTSPFLRRKKPSRGVPSPESSMPSPPALPTSAHPLPATRIFRAYNSSLPSPSTLFPPTHQLLNDERSPSRASHINILEAHKGIMMEEQTTFAGDKGYGEDITNRNLAPSCQLGLNNPEFSYEESIYYGVVEIERPKHPWVGSLDYVLRNSEDDEETLLCEAHPDTSFYI